jgi:hypothetical protein
MKVWREMFRKSVFVKNIYTYLWENLTNRYLQNWKKCAWYIGSDPGFSVFFGIPGTRYKRRGVDVDGHVANYVETEQEYILRISLPAESFLCKNFSTNFRQIFIKKQYMYLIYLGFLGI